MSGDSDKQKTAGALLDEWIKAHKHTNKVVADLVGCSPGYISNLRNDRLKAGRKTARALDVLTSGFVPKDLWDDGVVVVLRPNLTRENGHERTDGAGG